MIEGSRRPRIFVEPDGDEHPRWTEFEDFLGKCGISLDGWQEDVLRAALRRRGSLWAAFTVGMCVPRQNGKNEILMARELIGALPLAEKLQVHSAHLSDTSIEAFARMDDLIDGNRFLEAQVRHIRRTNGREAISFKGDDYDRRIRFRTRTRGGGRGFSGSPVYFDESMVFPVVSQNSILPVMSAQPDPQAWYMGSAVDKREQPEGLVFAAVRQRALEGGDDRLLYCEWSLDVELPELVMEGQAADPASWAATNPSLGIRITPEYVEAERRDLTPRGFAVERLGVGDWPDLEGHDVLLNIDAWDALENPEAELQPGYVLSFDVSPERHTSILLSGRSLTGKYMTKLIAHEAGTRWAVDRIAKAYADDSNISYVACDGLGPAAALILELEDRNVTVQRLTSTEMAESAGRFVDMVAEGELEHHGGPALHDAVAGAATRPFLDRFAWARKNSRVNIAPLVAATVGLGVAAGISSGPLIIY